MRRASISIFVIVWTMIYSANFCLGQKIGQNPIHTAIKSSTVQIDDEFGQHYSLARHYFSRADLNLAELEIEQAIAVEPQVKFAHRFYCLIALLRCNLYRAVAEFMMAVGLGQAIPLNAAEQAQLNADSAKAHYRKGLKYEEQRRYPRAIFEMRLAYNYAPQSLEIIRSLAFNLGKGGLFSDAEKLYQDSFKMGPQKSLEDAYAYADYAYLLASIHRTADAVEQLSKAIQIAPAVAALHVDLSLFLEQTGDLDRAAQEMQKAIKTAPVYATGVHHTMVWNAYGSNELRPSYASLWVHLGRVLDKQNKIGAARKAYSQALLLDAQNDLVKTRLIELQKQPPVVYASSAVYNDMEAQARALI